MKLAKTIGKIYDEAMMMKPDLIITNDIALATALNNLDCRPRIGKLAMTPRQIAAKYSMNIIGKAVWSDLRVIQTVSEETDLDFRYVHGEVTNIKEICKYKEDVAQFLSPSAKRIYNSWSFLPTLETVMRKFDADHAKIYEGLNIVTVGAEYFDRLDRMMVPSDSQNKDISLFEKGDFRMEHIYAIGNDRQLAENAMRLIQTGSPTDYAIVLASGSPLADTVRSALYRKGIAFVNTYTVRDLNYVRDYIQLVGRSLAYATLRVRDIRSLYASMNITISSKIDQHLLHKESFKDEKAESMRLLMKSVSEHDSGMKVTFLNMAEKMFEISKMDRRRLSSIKIVLQDLKLTDKVITPALFGKLQYAVDNVQDLHHNEEIPDYEKRGLLIADCKNSVFIDRPVVIYLGMEQDWNVDLVRKPYIPDIDEETEKQADRTSVMLQQGTVRFHLVNRTKFGKPAKPTTQFNEMEHRGTSPIESFRDLTDDYREERWVKEEKKEHSWEGPDSDKVYDHRFSQSKFSHYVRCPRAFMYDTLLSVPEKATMEFGNVVHEFAELYASHKKLVLEKGLDYFIERSCDRYSGLSTPLKDEVDENRIRCAIVNLTKYLESLGVPEEKADGVPDGMYPNWFYRNCFDEPIETTNDDCEKDEYSEEHKVHGKMDYRVDDAIIDYKTGASKSGTEIVKNFSLEKLADHPDFQCLFYLAIAKELKGRREFRLFFVMDNDIESQTEGYDIQRNVRTVRIVKKGDIRYDDPVVIEAFDADTSHRAKFKNRGEEFIRAILDNAQGPKEEWSSQDGIIRAIYEIFYDPKKKISNKQRKTLSDNISRYVKLLDNKVIAGKDTVYIDEGFLEDFMEKVDRMHDEMVESSCRFGGLEYNSESDCDVCDYRAVCTRVKIEDEKEAEQ